jgi:HD superfamily phosphohydrolase
MALFCDNRSAIALAGNYLIAEFSKYIDIYHHRVWDIVYNNTLLVMYIQIMDNLADMCTKGLPEV